MSITNEFASKTIFELLWSEMFLDHKYKSFNYISDENLEREISDLIDIQNRILKKKIGIENSSSHKTIYGELINYFEDILEIKWQILGRFQHDKITAETFLEEIENIQHREISMVFFLFMNKTSNKNSYDKNFIINFTEEILISKKLNIFFYFYLLISMINQKENKKITNILETTESEIFDTIFKHLKSEESMHSINSYKINESTTYTTMIEQLATIKCFFQKFKGPDTSFSTFMYELFKDYKNHIDNFEIPVFKLSYNYFSVIKGINKKRTATIDETKFFNTISNIYNLTIQKLIENNKNIVLLNIHKFVSWIFFSFYSYEIVSKQEYIERILVHKNKNELMETIPIIYYLILIKNIMNTKKNNNVSLNIEMLEKKENTSFQNNIINLLNEFVLSSVYFFKELDEPEFVKQILLFYFYEIRPTSEIKRKFLSIIVNKVRKINKKTVKEKGYFSNSNKDVEKNKTNKGVQEVIIKYWIEVM